MSETSSVFIGRILVHRALMLALVVSLCGCGVSSTVIRSEAVSYDDVIEDTTNKLLLLNILRAKDKAPLHFAEIPSIHETIQGTASVQATWPFGSLNKSTQRDSVGAALGVQMSPSFEIDHLDTKDFITGLSNPIDPKFAKYWLDRGLDRRVVLLLFFSAADIVKTDGTTVTSIRVRNSPREALDAISQQASLDASGLSNDLRCDAQSDFQRYLKLINSLTTFSAHAYTERRLLVDNLKLSDKDSVKDLADIAGLDPAKYQWNRHGDNIYTIYALSAEPKTALCVSNAPIGTTDSSMTKRSACVQSVVDSSDEDTRGLPPREVPIATPIMQVRAKPSSFCAQFNEFIAPAAAQLGESDKKAKLEIRLESRSVGEIIQFLGDLLEYEEALGKFYLDNPHPALQLNDPVTFGYCPEGATDQNPGCGDVFFNLRHDSCNARFAVSYRGQKYSVPNYNPPHRAGSCPAEESRGMKETKGQDHTLEVLAVVHQLVDLQKSAQDIKETPYVQLVP
jgi:hypothetical protein